MMLYGNLACLYLATVFAKEQIFMLKTVTCFFQCKDILNRVSHSSVDKDKYSEMMVIFRGLLVNANELQGYNSIQDGRSTTQNITKAYNENTF